MKADDLALISELDFNGACRSLVKRSREVDILGMSLRQCPETGTEYLVSVCDRIPSQVIPSLSDNEAEVQEGSIEEDELDAAAVHHAQTLNPSVEYNVILSPSYQVPVLYVILHNCLFSSKGNIEALHEILVPEHMRSDLKQVGVMGGISMTNHPFTHIPAYFIHPCKTAEAMQKIIGHSRVSPDEYLQIWFGLVGSCVGLYLPSQLVVRSPQGN